MRAFGALATALFTLGCGASALGQVEFSVVDVTHVSSPHGSYDDGDFRHGLTHFTADVIVDITTPGDEMFAQAVVAIAHWGSWHYTPDPNDPNVPRITLPGSDPPAAGGRCPAGQRCWKPVGRRGL